MNVLAIITQLCSKFSLATFEFKCSITFLIQDQLELMKALQNLVEMTIKLNPAFEDMAKALFTYVTSSQIAGTLKGGIAAMSNSPTSIQRTMDMHHTIVSHYSSHE